MAAEDREGWPPLVTAQVARTSEGKDHYNTLKLGYCYIYVQIFDDDMQATLADTEYSVRGLASGFSASGKTDGEGVLRHERVPDDHYELQCEGKTERIELLHHEHRRRHEGLPWALRLRGHAPSEDGSQGAAGGG